MPDDRRGNLLTALALVGVLGVLLAGWFAFPAVQAFLGRQDCIASGRTNCG